MFIIVFFDLPTNSKKERKFAQLFRKNLLNDGFIMFQYSVYTRHCSSKEKANKHINRIKNFMPEIGQISILKITDKQFGMMQNFIGKKNRYSNYVSAQLEMF